MIANLVKQILDLKIPEWFISLSVFYFILAATAIAALMVVTLKNVFHSAVALAVTLIGVAAVYLYLNSEFLAIMQILLYVGAILTLIIFAVMLTAKLSDRNIMQANEQKLASFLLTGALFAILAIAIVKMKIGEPAAGGTVALNELGRSFFTDYVLPFEFISLVLLAALIGAVALAFREKGDE
ncbi:MAG TPA: NADH-quinone oxidoreductase subunit J [bacterium]|nr:NADH-quinone oxidoreductase subunit J [bacterium]